MRITPDTNVLVSALISKTGYPTSVVDVALTFEDIELVLSKEILNELVEVLSREEVRARFDYPDKDIRRFVSALRKACRIIRIESNFKVVKEDPDDDKILNTAIDGRADYIVSGDSHLLALKTFRGIKIVNPRQMFEILKRTFGEVIIPRGEL